MPGSSSPKIDRHLLYELAVQAPAVDAAWFAGWYRRSTGRPLRTLREDFCGTAALACAFVRGGRGTERSRRRAIAVDVDAATLASGRQRNVAALPQDLRERVRLVHADVLAVRTPRVDAICALNFSYCVFHARAALMHYLRRCRAALRGGGVLWLDVFGGGLAHRPFAERTAHGAFAHVWEQRSFDPRTHRVDCRIHFQLRGGRILRDAFVYDWRMWTVPELRDALDEAGFAASEVLWQDPETDRFRRRRRPPADPHWLAYVMARR